MQTFYKTLPVPTFMYGSEIWVTTKAEDRIIQAQDMKLLKRFKGCNRVNLIIFKCNKIIKQN